MSDDAEGKTQSEVEELRKDQDNPGKIKGEGSGPTEADPGASTGSDPDGGSEAIGDGPSGGAEK